MPRLGRTTLRLGLRIGGTGTMAYQNVAINIPNCFAYYPMNENSGTTVLEKINGWNATYSNATLAQRAGAGASFGLAPAFNGTNTVIQLPAASLNGSFDPTKGTISFWEYLGEAWSSTNPRNFFQIGVDANNFLQDYKTSTANQILYAMVNGGAGAANSLVNSASGWHHHAVTWNRTGNTMIFYTDGLLINSVSIPGTWVGSLTNAYSTLGPGWLGNLQAFAMYSRALTGAEITTLSTAI